MKIVPVKPINPAVTTDGPRSKGPGQQVSEFARVLTAVTQTQKTTVSLLKPAPLMRTVTSLPQPAADELLSTAASLLDALENYQGLLADQRVSLRDLAPHLGRIEQTADRLAGLVEELPAQHPVKAPALQLLVTAAMEVERFNSGAYISG